MKFIRRFRATTTWSILFIVFAIALVPLLFVAEWFLCIANAYPEFDMEMFLFDHVHTLQYLSWSQIFFDFDNVMAEIPYDLMVALFLTGIFLLVLHKDHDGKQITMPRMGKGEFFKKVIVRNKGFYFIIVALAILITSWLGSRGLFGYQEAGADGRPLFFAGLDEYQFTSYFLPMLLFFAGFGAAGILSLVNLLGLDVKPRKNALVFMASSLLLFSVYFLFSPIHFELLVFQTFLERVLKLWLIVLFSTVYVIAGRLRKIRKSREFAEGEMKGRKIRFGPLVPWVSLSWLSILAIMMVTVGYAVLGELAFSAEPGILFKSTFNIFFTTCLTIGMYHLFGSLLSLSKNTTKEVSIHVEHQD
ncbi:MAG: hypothetical protein ACTSUE_00935 [Promethearchaeota archaeon]